MPSDARTILDLLAQVDHERAARAADAGLATSVAAVKEYQQRRFRRTYADLLANPRYAAAALFFLDELYGPRDFGERDAQFARVVPALVRLFPQEIVETVEALARLHALSERFDTAMGRHAPAATLDARSYRLAWQHTGDAPGREQQVELLLNVGNRLERLTRKPLLRRTLHLMRGPARAAGLATLQAFLETGFDTFAAMKGAQHFLQTVAERERALAAALFAASDEAVAGATLESSVESPLGQLP